MHVLALTTLLVSLLLAALYLYLYRLNREQHYRLWGDVWLLYALCIALEAVASATDIRGLRALLMLVALLCAWMMFRGTLGFLGRQAGRWWGVASVAAIVLTVVADAAGSSFALRAAPVCLLAGSMLVAAGLHLRQDPTTPPGARWAAVISLIFWGIHTMAYPVLRPIDSFVTLKWLVHLFRMLLVGGSLLALFTERAAWVVSSSRRLAVALAGTQRLDEGLKLCLDAALKISRTDVGGVYLFDEYGSLDLVESAGISDDMKTAVAHYGAESENAQFVRKGQPVYTQMNRVGDIAAKQMHSTLQAFAMVPVMTQGRIIGCLNVASKRFHDIDVVARQALEHIVAEMGDSLGRLKAEHNLRESERRMRAIFNSRYQSSAVLDLSGRMLTVNRVAADSAGVAESELQGKVWWEGPWWQRDPVQRDAARAAFECAQKGQTARVDVTYWNAASGSRQAEVTLSPMSDEAGHVVNVLAEGYDRTEERQMQARMRHAEKMQSVAILAGGVAHDFNNMLGGIIGYAQMSMDDVAADSLLARNLRQILKAGARARGLIRQLLLFSRPGDDERRSLLLAQVVQDAVTLTAASLPERVRVNVQISASGIMVHADETRMQAMVINLVTNAAQAMNLSGAIDVVIRKDVRTQPAEGRLGAIAPGEYAALEVKDTGCGMGPDIIDRIFDPFFTTKTPDKGTGLGLSIVYGIVQSHGGNIEVISEVGKGTTFRVLLPRTDGGVSSKP